MRKCSALFGLRPVAERKCFVFFFAAKNPLPDLDCSALTYVRACALERGHSCPQSALEAGRDACVPVVLSVKLGY
ncbi:MAG: hypothetical protein ACRD6X_05335 [Pyrinomonadaceae bacterium]